MPCALPSAMLSQLLPGKGAACLPVVQKGKRGKMSMAAAAAHTGML